MASLHPWAGGFGSSPWRLLGDLLCLPGSACGRSLCGSVRGPGAAPRAKALAFVSLQQSALIVQGPQEVKKRELVFLQFRLNQSDEDFSAIDYLLFSSFREFMQRWLLRVHEVSLPLTLCMSMLEMWG